MSSLRNRKVLGILDYIRLKFKPDIEMSSLGKDEKMFIIEEELKKLPQKPRCLYYA